MERVTAMVSGSRTLRAGAALIATLTLAGCRDIGLGGNIPLEQATSRELPYQVYETGTGSAGANVFAFGERNWMRSASTEAIPQNVMVSVGSASGTPVYAPAWAQAPHTRLYTPAARGRWHPLTPVP